MIQPPPLSAHEPSKEPKWTPSPLQRIPLMCHPNYKAINLPCGTQRRALHTVSCCTEAKERNVQYCTLPFDSPHSHRKTRPTKSVLTVVGFRCVERMCSLILRRPSTVFASLRWEEKEMLSWSGKSSHWIFVTHLFQMVSLTSEKHKRGHKEIYLLGPFFLRTAKHCQFCITDLSLFRRQENYR